MNLGKATFSQRLKKGYPDGDNSGLSKDELKLAKDLIFEIAGIDKGAIDDLFESLKQGQDAYANSIIQEINGRLASTLNFPNWWVQDTDFRMQVTDRDFDLTFTVVDRTGREYSFKERSSGLKYFLSYYIQYRAHHYSKGVGEILLMDEPDQFLSSRGQQDLLKIFESFVERKNARNDEEKSQKTQLVYVTHSPFLINKNYAQRIRVLEKGVGDEGTRVVKNVARNHYEPLRSAFGSFVAETTFIGNCNLMTEGPGDQIIVAGASMMLGRESGTSALETLDLNKITIVPAGGASNVPYMVYLAKGRDVERPAVIVMLDSDSAGDDAKKVILRGGPNKKQLIDPKFILQVGELSIEGDEPLVSATGRPAIEIEDLIPLRICFLAAKEYLSVMCHATELEANQFLHESIEKDLSDKLSIFETIEIVFKGINKEFRLDKVGFARFVVQTVEEIQSQPRCETEDKNALTTYINNMKVLFRKLSSMQRSAVRELSSKNISRRFERIRKSFVDDNKNPPKKEKALLVCEEIDAFLDDSTEADIIRMGLKEIRRVHELERNSHEAVADFENLKEDLNSLKYAPVINVQRESAAPLALESMEGEKDSSKKSAPVTKKVPTKKAAPVAGESKPIDPTAKATDSD